MSNDCCCLTQIHKHASALQLFDIRPLPCAIWLAPRRLAIA